jgi:TolB protein
MARPILGLAGLLVSLLLVACATPVAASLPGAQLLPPGDSIPGKILFVSGGNVWVWSGDRPRQITTGDTWQQPRWSPDGSRIAYVYRVHNFSEIFVMGADGSDPQRLTQSQSRSLADNDWALGPAWSPDGTQLAFVSDSGTYHPTLWFMNVDGSAKRQARNPQAFQEVDDAPAWSPDGKRVALTHFGPETSQIHLFEAPRGPFRQVTESPLGAFDPAWSPSGELLAYAVRETGRSEVRVRRLEDSTEATLVRTGYNRAPAWSPDGKRIAFLSQRGAYFDLYVANVVPEGDGFVARDERQLTRDLNLDGTSGLSWAP